MEKEVGTKLVLVRENGQEREEAAVRSQKKANGSQRYIMQSQHEWDTLDRVSKTRQ